MLKNHITYSDIRIARSELRTSGSGSDQNDGFMIRTGVGYEIFVRMSDLSEPEFLPPVMVMVSPVQMLHDTKFQHINPLCHGISPSKWAQKSMIYDCWKCIRVCYWDIQILSTRVSI